MSIVATEIERLKSDCLLRNWVEGEYLQRDRWDVRLQALIPPNAPYFNIEDKSTHYIWTPTLFREENFKKARYIVLNRWEAKPDPRKLMRLYKQRGWFEGDTAMKVYDREKGEWLRGEEYRYFLILNFLPRMWTSLGFNRKKLDGRDAQKMWRYRFNHACYFPHSFLEGLDGHHEKINNAIANKRIRPELKNVIGKEWLKATDDRPYNIVPLSRSRHYSYHLNKGDTGFLDYQGDQGLPMHSQ